MLREAAKIGPATIALFEAIMKAKPHPEQGFRSCLGILSLVRSYGPERVEAASRRGNDIGATTYGSIKSILQNGLDRAYANPKAPDARRSGTPTSAGVATTTEQRMTVPGTRAGTRRKPKRRDTMLTHPTHDRLVALGLIGMAKALEEQRKQPDITALTFEERLALLVDREAIERENKRLVSRLKFASLRQSAVVEDVDMKAQAGVCARPATIQYAPLSGAR